MPEVPVSGTFREYYANLWQKLEYMRRHLVTFHDRRIELTNKDKQHHGFFIGQIVYAVIPGGSPTQTGSKKIKINCVCPLVIMNCMNPNQFQLMTIDKQTFRGLLEETI